MCFSRYPGHFLIMVNLTRMVKAPIVLLVLVLIKVSLSKHVKGILQTSENWAFLSKFCFQSDNGSLTFDIEYDSNFEIQKLLLYSDFETPWPIVYKSNKSCQEREEIAREGINQIIPLNVSGPNIHCDLVQSHEGKIKYKCLGFKSFMSWRKSWWFIAVSNCESTNGLSLRYSLTMTNGFSFWYKHFSAEEFYILQTYLSALSIEVVLLFLSIVAFDRLNSRQLLHKTYRLYMTALIIQIIGLTFLSIYYIYYGVDGIGSLDIKVIGSILLSMSNIMSVMCLLMMGQISNIKLTLFMCIFSCTSMSFVFVQQDFDQEIHMHESPLGYVMMTMRCAAWLVFLHSCFFNIKHYQEKSSFYYPLVLFYTPWFLATPIVLIASNYFIDDFEREKVISLVDIGISILGHVFFLVITGLNLSNKNLENHVRQSQVSTAEFEKSKRSESGAKSLEPRSHCEEQIIPKYANSEVSIVPRFEQMMQFKWSGDIDLFYQEQRGDRTTTFMASKQEGRKLRNSLQRFNPNMPPPLHYLPPMPPLPSLHTKPKF